MTAKEQACSKLESCFHIPVRHRQIKGAGETPAPAINYLERVSGFLGSDLVAVILVLYPSKSSRRSRQGPPAPPEQGRSETSCLTFNPERTVVTLNLEQDQRELSFEP